MVSEGLAGGATHLEAPACRQVACDLAESAARALGRAAEALHEQMLGRWRWELTLARDTLAAAIVLAEVAEATEAPF